jgi:hypothetical protein
MGYEEQSSTLSGCHFFQPSGTVFSCPSKRTDDRRGAPRLGTELQQEDKSVALRTNSHGSKDSEMHH